MQVIQGVFFLRVLQSTQIHTELCANSLTACATSCSWLLLRESPFIMQYQWFKHGQGDKFVSVKTSRKSVNGERNVRSLSQELSRMRIEQLIQSGACGSSRCKEAGQNGGESKLKPTAWAMHSLDKITSAAWEKCRSAGWLIRIDVAFCFSSVENCIILSCSFFHV